MFASPLSPRIQVEPTGNGARYLLGPRDVGPLRWLGLVPVAVGIGIAAALLAAALDAWSAIAPHVLPAERPLETVPDLPLPWPVLLFMAVFGLIFLRAAFLALRFGLFVLAGRSEILLEPGRLTMIERGGPLFRRERVPLEGLAVLRIEDASAAASRRTTAAPGAWRAGASLARLLAIPLSGKSRTLAIGYPAAELEVLAGDLAERIPAASIVAGAGVATTPRVERTEVVQPADGARDNEPERRRERHADAQTALDRRRAAQPPAGTSIEISRASGLEIHAPPVGLFRGSRGLAVFGLLWTLFTGGMLFAASFASGMESIPLILLALFVAIGLVILYSAARMGWRRTEIAVQPPLLRIERRTFGGARVDELRLDELRDVALGPSGLRINGRDVPELKLHLDSSRKIGLLIERRPEELEWLAALLRSELGLPRRDGADGAPTADG